MRRDEGNGLRCLEPVEVESQGVKVTRGQD
jgi:hypothetical protein